MQSPNHYGDTKLLDLLIEKDVPFTEGNIMKYVYRWRQKDGLKDLYKALNYLNALIAYEELHIESPITACYTDRFIPSREQSVLGQLEAVHGQQPRTSERIGPSL